VPTVVLPASPLAPGVSPVVIHYRDVGHGAPPLVILHGGWGYDIYAFNRQIAALSGTHRIVIPDRTGYGGSGRLAVQLADFHDRAAAETLAVLDALGLESPVVWGHSDGAVTALKMGLSRPDRVAALIVEAAHFYRSKPRSREFFETMVNDPDGLGERVAGILAAEHGDSWRDLIRINGVAWLRIADERSRPDEDLYGGRLPQLCVPTLIVHGAKDPRTEPGELEAIRASIPQARVALIAEGGHSPHNERLAGEAVTREAERFLADISADVNATRRR
jgi:pimeloyl-ACP methyl ester carboxylesterase